MPETGHWLYTWVGGGRDCKVRESRWSLRGHWGSREGISFTYRPGDAKMGESIRSEKMLVKVPPTTYILIIKKKLANFIVKKLADATLTKWCRFPLALI